MWCVREVYSDPKGSLSYCYRGFWSDKKTALIFARSCRRALNRYWRVELCNVSVSSVECVA